MTKRRGGAVESVQYYELVPVLLNELQRQGMELQELKAQNAALAARLVRLKETPHTASPASR